MLIILSVGLVKYHEILNHFLRFSMADDVFLFSGVQNHQTDWKHEIVFGLITEIILIFFYLIELLFKNRFL